MAIDEQERPADSPWAPPGAAEQAGAVGLEADIEPESSPLPGSAVDVEPAPPPPRAEPVKAAERVASVDVIRGVAVLGILAMNIVGFAWPGRVYATPTAAEGAGWVDTALWAFNHLVFDTKMMTLFSMLFGAGLVLMSERAEARGARIRGVYYRRVTWLLVIGLVHAYLIWDGDILVLYASCGYLLYLFRRKTPRTLIALGLCLNLLLVPLFLGFKYVGMPFMERTAAQVEAERKAGQTPAGWREKVAEAWTDMNKREMPKREDFLKSIRIHRGPYWELVQHRAPDLLMSHTLGFVLGGLWLVGGRMLIGMGLLKLGVFSAQRSSRFYLTMMALGYGIGLPLMVFDAVHLIRNDFFVGRGLDYMLAGWPFLNFYGSLPVVFGHIGLVMWVCRSGVLTGLTRRLAAVGRMALSNYLFDSLLCTTLFYGYGLDLFGTIHRPLLYAIVLAIWTFQLLVSPLWLEHFRFGPAEWLWRSLTYWKPQPLWRSPEPALA